jgi:Ran GTPase-activating protein (RanGAP) involved in mRNA processing and transport
MTEMNDLLSSGMAEESDCTVKCFAVRDLQRLIQEDSTLRELNLRNCWLKTPAISKYIALALKGNTSLTSLRLERNWFGNDGAQLFAEALKTNKNLTSLNLGLNRIDPTGIESLANALRSNYTLLTLNLSGNVMGNLGAKYLSNALQINQTLTSLDLSLTGLGLYYIESGMWIATLLKSTTSLKYLNIDGNHFHKEELCYICDALKVNTSLQTLEMSDIKQSSNDDSLLDAHWCQHLSSMLAINKSLTELFLARNNFRNDGVSKLAVGLTKNATLTKLDLSRNRIGTSGMDSLATALCENQSLLELCLADNSIGDNGMKKLSKILENNIALKILDLTHNGIGVIGQIYLSQALANNMNLTDLILYDNHEFFDEETSGEWMSGMKLAEALIVNKTLRKLEIGLMKSAIWPQISIALMMNQSLTTLNARYCSLGGKGTIVDMNTMEVLCESLKMNTALTSLSLERNKLGSSSIQILFDMLASNKTIAILDLSDNAIDDVGAKVIATCLEENSTTLTDLNLNGNCICEDGLVLISRSLEVNKGLTKLDIGGNSFGKEGIRELAKSLARNTSLRSLVVGDRPQSENSFQYLHDALLDNKTLTDLQIGVSGTSTILWGPSQFGIYGFPDLFLLSMTSMLEQNRELRPSELRSRFSSTVRLNFTDVQLIFE